MYLLDRYTLEPLEWSKLVYLALQAFEYWECQGKGSLWNGPGWSVSYNKRLDQQVMAKGGQSEQPGKLIRMVLTYSLSLEGHNEYPWSLSRGSEAEEKSWKCTKYAGKP